MQTCSELLFASYISNDSTLAHTKYICQFAEKGRWTSFTVWGGVWNLSLHLISHWSRVSLRLAPRPLTFYKSPEDELESSSVFYWRSLCFRRQAGRVDAITSVQMGNVDHPPVSVISSFFFLHLLQRVEVILSQDLLRQNICPGKQSKKFVKMHSWRKRSHFLLQVSEWY